MVIGDGGVGKTSILNRFIENTFDPNAGPSNLGQDFKSKNVTIDGKAVKLNIWDTAGQDTAALLTRSYYKKASGALLVFDVTSSGTFNSLPLWVEDLDRYSDNVTQKIIVGNKNDESTREVDADRAKNYADKNGWIYIEASAKSGNNIDHIFSTLARLLLTKYVFFKKKKNQNLLSNMFILT